MVDENELAPEARVLIGEVANGLGPLPSGSPLRGLADALAAVGAVELADDGRVTVVTDAMERLLLDPIDELRRGIGTGTAGREAFLAALRSWLGAAPSGDDAVVVPLGAALEHVVRLDSPVSFELRTTTAGFAIGAGGRLDGSVRLDLSGRRAAELRGSALSDLAPTPAPSLVASVDTAAVETVTVALEQGAATLELYPTPSAELPGRGAAILVGELLRVAAEWAAGEAPAVVVPLLDVLGLQRDGRVRNLGGLISEPGAWLTHPSVLGHANGGGPAPTRPRCAGCSGLRTASSLRESRPSVSLCRGGSSWRWRTLRLTLYSRSCGRRPRLQAT